MSAPRTIMLGTLAFVPFTLLVAAGALHLQNGLVMDNAFPVPLYLAINVPVPVLAYQDAAASLSASNPIDGNARISLAEARWHAGTQTAKLLPQIDHALMGAPATAEGWMSLAEMQAAGNPAAASRALSQAYILAPFDFYLPLRRAQLAAQLWDRLGTDTQKAALEQVRLMWGDWKLKDSVLRLLQTPEGRILVQRAYPGDTKTPAQMLSWALARRRGVQSGQL